MNTLVKKLEDIMVAITFAEAGELEEANRLAGNTIELTGQTLDRIGKSALEGASK